MKDNNVTIVIPVYNGKETIDRCLKSVCKSTYPNYECIVVDDRSKDNTVEIAESFNAKIKRLNRQKGSAYARNRGAEDAKGSIILFL